MTWFERRRLIREFDIANEVAREAKEAAIEAQAFELAALFRDWQRKFTAARRELERRKV